MKNRASNGPTVLSGDWTIGGVVHQVDSLLKLVDGWSRSPSGTVMTIDCSLIENIDTSGLQLLYTWAMALKFTGVRPRFVDIQKHILASQTLLGFTTLFDSLDNDG